MFLAEEIVAAGVHSEIPHGQDSKVYESILAGQAVDYSRGSKRKRRAVLDADAELPLAVAPPNPAKQDVADQAESPGLGPQSGVVG